MTRSSIIFLSILAYVTVAQALIQKENLSVYDILKQYDFPVGLLPQGATGYELNEKTGKFTVYFEGTCIFGIESYDLKYKSTIKGVISKGKLAKLKGISVKIELLWLKIVEVTRHGDDLQFSVGIASADFSVDNFLEIPQCGCGFDCNNFHKNGFFGTNDLAVLTWTFHHLKRKPYRVYGVTNKRGGPDPKPPLHKYSAKQNHQL